jgi:hypothetical protein
MERTAINAMTKLVAIQSYLDRAQLTKVERNDADRLMAGLQQDISVLQAQKDANKS